MDPLRERESTAFASKKPHFRGEGSSQLSLEASTASTEKMEDGPALVPRRMIEWLNFNYTKKKSKGPYVVTLKNWLRFVYGDDIVGEYMGLKYGKGSIIRKRNKEKRISEIEDGIERYFNDLDHRNFLKDYKNFIHWMLAEKYANLTIRSMCSKVKLFFGTQDPRCKIKKGDWRQIKRALMPKSTRAATQDEILEKEDLKRVMRCLSIHGRALALFLISTGARQGESCKLTMEDIHLYDDPPWVNIREEYTKGDVGGRVMWFSEEARDAILEWHEERKTRKKSGGGPWDENLVFNFTPKVFATHWNAGLLKADRGADPPVLSRRDPSTKKRIHVYHAHTTRKFFRTNMGVEGSYKGRSGIPPEIIHAYIGHKAYLSEYERLTKKGMAKIYKENMHIVTVHYEDFVDESVATKDAEIAELKAEIARLKGAPIDEDALAKRLYDKIMKMNQIGTPMED